jgi:hypothetical protein
MDGEVIRSAIVGGFLDANPPRLKRFEGSEAKPARPCGEDEDEMGDLLKGLGYLN